LGMNLKQMRILIVVSASAITAAVVSACGVIGWVGLLVPHIARMLLGNDNRYCEPASMVLGGLFMLVTDTAARCMTASEIPVSILTALIGAPVFILLLRKTGGIRA
ncbi:MAG: iron chelate uptake ABC transporter family permease subunit, partial [Stecheria intestinalis]|nr:iron chelate uptake ABC transporter family permease subunit [Stecheria intestinalis]